jgi:hypothetical protein
MNSKQPFGTRNFASGRWGQCGEQSQSEQIKDLKRRVAEDRKIIDSLRKKIHNLKEV